MYLEQELESLKAVLEIKNEKLHQQDNKLLKMEKLVSFALKCWPPKSRFCADNAKRLKSLKYEIGNRHQKCSLLWDKYI